MKLARGTVLVSRAERIRMCREALVINGSTALAERIASLQSNGGSMLPETWRRNNVTMIHQRFPVTSDSLPVGTFPLEGSRYVLAYNGEVYEFRGQKFDQRKHHPSDVHFALSLIDQYGLEEFLKDVDFQGTYQIHDKATGDTYIIVDQLNTCGCFYAEFAGCFVMASEHAVVHAALEFMDAPIDVPINVIQNGTFLKISKDGEVKSFDYRPDYRGVWGGAEYSIEHFANLVQAIRGAVWNATVNRIPVDGPVAVLVGGGVDSSLILTNVVRALQNRQELDRLMVFTLGTPAAGSRPADNDLLNTHRLLQELQLDSDRFLTVINPAEIQVWRDFLLRTTVYCRKPRLITPNPVRTQMRHTITMSCVLARIVERNPDIMTVLTGDAADELFAGYNSMRQGALSPGDLRHRIQDKLQDLPLNDAARVMLASCHGVVAILKKTLLEPALHGIRHRHTEVANLAKALDTMTSAQLIGRLSDFGIGDPELIHLASRVHPIEVRMPFTCHHILRALQNAHADYAVGKINGTTLPKFLLRVVALESGVPFGIASRPKVPFHEGGSGTRNADCDSAEMQAALDLMSEEELLAGLNDSVADLRRLGITHDEDSLDHTYAANNVDKLGLFAAACYGGIKRMVKGNIFRSVMRDSIYSTDVTGTEYVPSELIECGVVNGRIKYRRQSEKSLLV